MQKLLLASMILLMAAAPPIDKKLIDKTTNAWLSANTPSKDYAVTAAVGIFIAKGVWKASGKGPKAMSQYKLALISCVNDGAKLIKSKNAEPRGVAESIFACSIYKGFVSN